MLLFTRIISLFVLVCFLTTSAVPGIGADTLVLPSAGQLLPPGGITTPVILKGMIVNPKEPFKFDFLVDTGSQKAAGAVLKEESDKSIRYFLASLTTPDDDLWVNLSPVEKDRVIPENFGKTTMGRDVLAQDYILKQLTSSLLYPEQETGKKFWTAVYKEVSRQGVADINTDDFNRVWIVPGRAQVWENNGKVVVLSSHLKVMLERDYKAGGSAKNADVSREALREVLLPVLEREVNEGTHFARLRQVFAAMILAAWYKIRLKEGLLGKVYANQQKVAGIEFHDGVNKDDIYARYLEALKKGVFNYIREEEDPFTGNTIPRKYFSGGFAGEEIQARVAEELKNPKTLSEDDAAQGFRKGLMGNLVSASTIFVSSMQGALNRFTPRRGTGKNVVIGLMLASIVFAQVLTPRQTFAQDVTTSPDSLQNVLTRLYTYNSEYAAKLNNLTIPELMQEYKSQRKRVVPEMLPVTESARQKLWQRLVEAKVISPDGDVLKVTVDDREESARSIEQVLKYAKQGILRSTHAARPVLLILFERRGTSREADEAITEVVQEVLRSDSFTQEHPSIVEHVDFWLVHAAEMLAVPSLKKILEGSSDGNKEKWAAWLLALLIYNDEVAQFINEHYPQWGGWTRAELERGVQRAVDLYTPTAGEEGKWIKSLTTSGTWQRFFAATILGKMKASEAVPALIKLAQSDPEPLVRRAAIIALGKIGDVRAIPMLLDKIRASEVEFWPPSLRALESIGVALPEGSFQRIVDSWTSFISDLNGDKGRSYHNLSYSPQFVPAAAAIAICGREKAIGVLASQFLASPNHWIRRAGISAYLQMPPEIAAKGLQDLINLANTEQDDENLQTLYRVLTYIGEPAIPFLSKVIREYLSASNPSVPPAPLEPSLDLSNPFLARPVLPLSGPADLVKANRALTALGLVGSAQSVSVLFDALENSNLSTDARQFLLALPIGIVNKEDIERKLRSRGLKTSYRELVDNQLINADNEVDLTSTKGQQWLSSKPLEFREKVIALLKEASIVTPDVCAMLVDALHHRNAEARVFAAGKLLKVGTAEDRRIGFSDVASFLTRERGPEAKAAGWTFLRSVAEGISESTGTPGGKAVIAETRRMLTGVINEGTLKQYQDQKKLDAKKVLELLKSEGWVEPDTSGSAGDWRLTETFYQVLNKPGFATVQAKLKACALPDGKIRPSEIVFMVAPRVDSELYQFLMDMVTISRDASFVPVLWHSLQVSELAWKKATLPVMLSLGLVDKEKALSKAWIPALVEMMKGSKVEPTKGTDFEFVSNVSRLLESIVPLLNAAERSQFIELLQQSQTDIPLEKKIVRPLLARLGVSWWEQMTPADRWRWRIVSGGLLLLLGGGVATFWREKRSKSADPAQLGGIDLDPRKLDLQVKRDDQGLPLPLEHQDWSMLALTGLTPIIDKISVVSILTLFDVSPGFSH